MYVWVADNLVLLNVLSLLIIASLRNPIITLALLFIIVWWETMMVRKFGELPAKPSLVK